MAQDTNTLCEHKQMLHGTLNLLTQFLLFSLLNRPTLQAKADVTKTSCWELPKCTAQCLACMHATNSIKVLKVYVLDVQHGQKHYKHYEPRG